MVQIPEGEPSTLGVDITDGSESKVGPSTLSLNIADGPYLRSEPSTLMLHIVDGSILQDRTFHDNASYHGWFEYQRVNHPS